MHATQSDEDHVDKYGMLSVYPTSFPYTARRPLRTYNTSLACGQEYLDFVAGISTCALGHADPDLAAAVGDQMNKFHHVSNLYYIPEQVPHTYIP